MGRWNCHGSPVRLFDPAAEPDAQPDAAMEAVLAEIVRLQDTWFGSQAN